MRRRAVLLLALMLAPVASFAQDASAFAGEWRNPKKDTASIVGARVYQQGGRWMLQLLGRCTPNPCVWDPLPLNVVAEPRRAVATQATATFSRSNMRRLISLHLGEDTLVVTVASHQLAVPGRGIGERRYTSTDELAFVTAKTEPLPGRRTPK